MSFEAPLVTDMTPVDDAPRGAHGGQARQRGGWQGNDDEHPDVSFGADYNSCKRHMTYAKCFSLILYEFHATS